VKFDTPTHRQVLTAPHAAMQMPDSRPRYLPAIAILLTILSTSHATTRYVSPDATPSLPYLSWATAATNIQDAISVSSTGDVILVTNAIYFLSNTISITNGVMLKSVNGHQTTIIDGGGLTRCVQISGLGGTLEGFTIQNGHQSGTNGAGIYMTTGIVDRCNIINNMVVAGASGAGVQINGGILRNSLVAYNNAAMSGGGIEMNSGSIENCTIVSNTAGTNAGGLYTFGGTILNSVVYHNTSAGAANYNNATFNYCCTTPQPAGGTGNFTNEPAFANPGAGDFAPGPGSPLINAGQNQPWMAAASDLNGNPRIEEGIVEIGCYEVPAAPPLRCFRVFLEDDPSDIIANEYFTIRVEAWEDSSIWSGYTGTVMFASNPTGDTPGNYQFTTNDAGVHLFTNVFRFFMSHGGADVTVTDVVDINMQGGLFNFRVFNGYTNSPPDWFDIRTPDPVTAFHTNSFSVAALNFDDYLVTNFLGTIGFTSSDGTATLPPNYAFTTGNKGYHTFTNALILRSIGEQWLQVADTVQTNLWGRRYNLTVQGEQPSTGGLSHIVVDLTDLANTNDFFDITIEGRDDNEHVVTSFWGNLEVSCTDPNAAYSTNLFISGLANGRGSFPGAIAFRTPGLQTTTIRWLTDTNLFASAQTLVQSDPLPMGPGWIRVRSSDDAVAGYPCSFKVFMLDGAGFPDTNFSGGISISYSDPGATGPTNHLFTPPHPGFVSFTNALTWSIPGEQTIWVNEDAPGTRFGEDGYSVMEPGASNTFSIRIEVMPNPAVVGQASGLRLFAFGDAGKIHDAHTNAITLSSPTDPGAVFPNNNYNPFINGVADIATGVTFSSGGTHRVEVRIQGDTNLLGATKALVVGGGTIWYVDDRTGDDGFSGNSPSTPWRTINRAMSAVTPGSVVHIAPERYKNPVTVTVSGALNQPIAFLADIENRFWPDRPGDMGWMDAGTQTCVHIEGCTDIVFTGFDFETEDLIHHPGTGIVIRSSNRITLYDCEVSYRDVGIAIVDSSKVTFEDSHLDDCMEESIRIINPTDVSIRGVETEWCGAGLAVSGSGGSSLSISGSDFENHFGDGIQIGNGMATTIIEHCYIQMNATNGVRITGATSKVTFKNNLIAFNLDNAVHGGQADQLDIVNNTLHSNGRGLFIQQTLHSDIRNNIISLNAGEGISLDSMSATDTVLDFNCLYANSINWADFAVPGIGCISNDPEFASLSVGMEDFHLTSMGGRFKDGWVVDPTHSPCIDAGDTNSPFADEPSPNGGRINLGAYGGTPEASKSFVLSHEITATSFSTNGTVSPTGTIFVTQGGTQAYTFTPAPHYHVSEVWVDGTPIGPTNTYTFLNVTNGPRFITVDFSINTYTLDVTSIHGFPSPSGITTQEWGTLVPASVDEIVSWGVETQYVCTGWIGSGSIGNGAGTNTTSFVITNNTVLAWTWKTQYWLTATAFMDGSVTGSNAWHDRGSGPVVFEAVPDADFRFVNWTGNLTSTNNPLSLTANQSYDLMANFAPQSGSIRVTLSTSNAIAAGAQWRLITGPNTNWNNSGITVSNLPTANNPYMVLFQTIPGFTAPQTLTNVVVSYGALTDRSGAYLAGDMLLLMGNTYMMGNSGGTGGRSTTVSPFYMDTREVTVGEYQAFATDTGRGMPSAPPWGFADTNRPMVNVTWADAQAYAAWIGKRLPTEAEYEFAMRGGITAIYPWGDTISPADACYRDSGMTNANYPAQYPANGYGMYDMAGNVWEWCSDWFTSPLTGGTDPLGPVSGTYKVIRGGSYSQAALTLRCSARYQLLPATRHMDVGFRCAATAGTGGSGGATSSGDTNDNGIPDWWEKWYFGKVLTGADSGTADPDADGRSNRQEYQAGTDPIDANSVLMILGVETQPDGRTVIITWTSVEGKAYNLERCTNLITGFQSIHRNLPATTPINTFTDTLDSTPTTLFYRVGVE